MAFQVDSNTKIRQARALVSRYNSDPNQFTDVQAEKIAFIAYKLSMPFRPESKVLQKFAFELADSLTFGILDDSKKPTSRGETVFGETASDKLSGTVGSLLGLVAPGVAGYKLGGAAGAALAKSKTKIPFLGATTQMRGSTLELSKLGSAIQGAAQGAATGGLMDILEDPLGAPSRAITGGVLGGALGAFWGAPPIKPRYTPMNRTLSSGPQLSQTAGGTGRGGIPSASEVRVVAGSRVTNMSSQKANDLANMGILREVPRRPATVGDAYKGRIFEYIDPRAAGNQIDLGTGASSLLQLTQNAGSSNTGIAGLFQRNFNIQGL